MSQLHHFKQSEPRHGLIVPTLSLNGSSADALLDDRYRARAAVEVAIEAVGAGGPHGRDYQESAEKLALVTTEHRRRLDVLEALRAALTEEIELIEEQVKAREAMRRRSMTP